MEKEIKDQNLSNIAIKNSGYVFARTLISKLGGLFFTVIIARILLPELFGIYALAISIITIFMTFTELGVNRTFLRYSSEALGKKDKSKARSYFRYLLRIKFYLVFIVILALLLLSRFISYNLYEKPLLFYPLIFASLFILMESFKEFVATIFYSVKDIKYLPLLDLIYQLSKISLSLLAVSIVATNFKISSLFIAFALSGVVYLFLSVLILAKKDKKLFLGKIVKIDKKKVVRYLCFMSVVSISLAFFGAIDTLMLGKFVEAEYIAYYRVALSLILTITSLFSLSGIFLPIFTQIHKRRFKRGFQKIFRYLMIIAIPAIAGLFFIGKQLIFAVYGKEYLLATSVFYFLSLLVIISPLESLYSLIFQSKDRTKLLARGVIISLILNIFLNYALIKYLINFSQEHAMMGVGIATVLSRAVFLLILSTNAKKRLGLSFRGLGLRSPFFATLIMALFLLLFNKFVGIGVITGILEIILATGIYFGALILTKGLNKEDFKLIKSLIKNR